jgi:flagellar assembly factor FliW
VHWLQAVDDADTALLVADPDLIFPEYNAEVEDRDLAPIGVNIDKDCNEPPPIVLHVVLSVDRAMGKVTANLRAPILINVDSRQGIQIALKRGDYSVRQPLPRLKKPAVNQSEDSPMERVSVAANS